MMFKSALSGDCRSSVRRLISVPSKSSSFTGSRSMNSLPSACTEIYFALCGGSFWCLDAVGSFKSMSFTGGMVEMMKITSNTNARSSIGVMFNSVSDSCALCEHFFMERFLVSELRGSGLFMAFQGAGDLVLNVAVVHVGVLNLVGVTRGKAVQFLRDVPDGRHHEVVAEHRRNRHEQAGDRGDQPRSHARRHRREAGGVRLGNTRKRGHHS